MFERRAAAVGPVGCGGNGGRNRRDGGGDYRGLSVRCTGPARTWTRRGGGLQYRDITYHLFENLLRWEDDGTGKAVLANGMASSYTEEKNNDGSTTYTFRSAAMLGGRMERA